MKQYARAALIEAGRALDAMQNNQILLETVARAASGMADALNSGSRVFSCGNGGSMCDATHFAEELSGRYRQDRAALAATAINDVGHITCVANDYGYEYVFSRYIEAHGHPGDFLVAISTSGSSKSIINSASAARDRGMLVIGLHGRHGSPLSELSDFDICTPAGEFADRVQECHIKVIHIMIEIIERKLFRKNYVD